MIRREPERPLDPDHPMYRHGPTEESIDRQAKAADDAYLIAKEDKIQKERLDRLEQEEARRDTEWLSDYKERMEADLGLGPDSTLTPEEKQQAHDLVQDLVDSIMDVFEDTK